MKNKNILVTKQLLLNVSESRRFCTTAQFYLPARNVHKGPFYFTCTSISRTTIYAEYLTHFTSLKNSKINNYLYKRKTFDSKSLFKKLSGISMIKFVLAIMCTCSEWST